MEVGGCSLLFDYLQQIIDMSVYPSNCLVLVRLKDTILGLNTWYIVISVSFKCHSISVTFENASILSASASF